MNENTRQYNIVLSWNWIIIFTIPCDNQYVHNDLGCVSCVHQFERIRWWIYDQVMNHKHFPWSMTLDRRWTLQDLEAKEMKTSKDLWAPGTLTYVSTFFCNLTWLKIFNSNQHAPQTTMSSHEYNHKAPWELHFHYCRHTRSSTVREKQAQGHTGRRNLMDVNRLPSKQETPEGEMIACNKEMDCWRQMWYAGICMNVEFMALLLRMIRGAPIFNSAFRIWRIWVFCWIFGIRPSAGYLSEFWQLSRPSVWTLARPSSSIFNAFQS